MTTSAARPPGSRVPVFRGPQVVALGLGVFLLGGVLTALLAAAWLDAVGYTVYAAFSAALGILMLGPASSLEQESSLRASQAQRGSRDLLRAMTLRGGAIWAVAALVVLVPVGQWQQRLLGDEATTAAALVVAGIPVVFLLAVARGVAVARSAFRVVAAAHATTGVGMVALPPLLHLGGLPWLTCFLAGAVLAWFPPVLLMVVAARRGSLTLRSPRHGGEEDRRRRVTAWIVAGNLLVLANLLAVPAVLRWHVEGIGAGQVADVQLLVSVSRLATTAVLGFLPLVIGRLVADGGRVTMRRAAPLSAAATLLAAVAVVGAAVAGDPFIAWLTGREVTLTLEVNLLATVPVLALSPAIVLMGTATVRGQHALVATAWGSGVAALAIVTAVDPGGDIRAVLVGIVVAAVLPLAVLVAGLALRGPRVARVEVPSPATLGP